MKKINEVNGSWRLKLSEKEAREICKNSANQNWEFNF